MTSIDRSIDRPLAKPPDSQRARNAMTTTANDVCTAPMTLISRDQRQADVQAWCVATFGNHDALFVPQRGLRLVEVAIETAQACGCDPALIHSPIDHIYAKPVGDLPQELGGLGVTILALAGAAGVSADAAEASEFARVKAKPLSHFAARNAAKTAAGFHVADARQVDGN